MPINVVRPYRCTGDFPAADGYDHGRTKSRDLLGVLGRHHRLCIRSPRTPQASQSDVRAVARLKLKPSMRKMFLKSVSLLGHVISERGVATDPGKVESMMNWPAPTCIREVRSFVDLCSCYRLFVHSFAEIAALLHELTGKGIPLIWTPACQMAFEALKTVLASSPILAMPTNDDIYVLDIDASDHSIGAVMYQIQSGEERVIAYGSRTYSKAERNYCTTRKELPPIVYFMKQFKQYLLVNEFLVRTDHAALTWLQRIPEIIGQQNRWQERLQEYSFKIEHRPGLNTKMLTRSHDDRVAVRGVVLQQTDRKKPTTRAVLFQVQI